MSDLTTIKTQFGAETFQAFKEVYGGEAAAKLRQEAAFVFEMMNTNTALKKADQKGIGFCLSQVAIMGLTIMPARKQAHLVVFGNKCQLLIGYQGEIDMLSREGVIVSCKAEVIREGDHFTHEETEKGFLYKFRKSLTPGKILGAFAVYTLPNGKTHGRVITNEDIDKRRKVSRGGFWAKDKWETEMILKTAVRMARHGLPSSKATEMINNADSWTYQKEAQTIEIDDNRISELRAAFGATANKAAMVALFRALPPHERENEDVRALYIEINETKEKELA